MRSVHQDQRGQGRGEGARGKLGETPGVGMRGDQHWLVGEAVKTGHQVHFVKKVTDNSYL